MQIQKIDIYNFGPFYGKHSIEFSDCCKGVHIIRGGNGQGKTSLQRAVIWALYSNIYDRKREKIRESSLLNQSALKDGNYHFEITIYFTHEERRWILFRKMEAKSHVDKSYVEGMVLALTREGDPIEDAQSEIERIIPSEVSRFYFFDGEMLRDYEELLEESGRSRLLKNSIELIIGVPYFRYAIEDLVNIKNKLEKRINQSIKKCGGKSYGEIANDLDIISEDINEKNMLITKLNDQLNSIQEEISSKKGKLAKLGDVQELGEKGLKLNNDLRFLERDKNDALKDLRILITNLYKTILVPVSKEVIPYLEAKNKEVNELYNYKQRLLEKAEMLKKGMSEARCKTCGTILNKDKLLEFEDKLKRTNEEIASLINVSPPDYQLDIYKNVLETLSDRATKRDELDKINAEINEIDARITTNKSQQSQLLEKLKGVDAEEPRRIAKEIESLINEEGRLQGTIKSEIDDINELLKLKRELDAKIANINNKEVNSLRNTIENIDPLIKIFEKAISIYREKKKTEIESIASSIFRQIRSKDSFDRLKINDQYGLSIITNEGTILDRSEWRSSGEEQLVALALIGALNKCAQISAPVFMDTPFGRLDIAHGERVLKFIPDLAEQVIILVTDREFKAGDETYLDGKIKSDNSIIFKNEVDGSIILKTSGRVIN